MSDKQNAETRPETGADATPETHSPDAASQAAEAAAAATAADGDTRVAELEGEVAKLKDQLLRALAEQENIRRRTEREREDTAKYAISKFAKDLLGVADNLRRAVESVPEEQRQSNDAVNSLLTGVEATERQLTAAFERAGIAKMDALDKPADPNFHQIMMEIEGTGKPAGTVVQVLQPGYTIAGRLLREAIVGVSKGGDQPKVDTSA
ncbi:nucleotide exchange factor GrpE [Indioceanicola profundi]|uniref:nucleotide exchange factor GrpE n=1 Tax=Indioceanicola profundi TaxID=2220096 RepID=UPI000E6A9A4D|nr:nucleotide exchange factor GrpE [Indioceanicola profundi]